MIEDNGHSERLAYYLEQVELHATEALEHLKDNDFEGARKELNIAKRDLQILRVALALIPPITSNISGN